MSAVLAIFLIASLGYLVGSAKVLGLQLGTSGVLLVALIFGHYGAEVPGLVRDVGLVCFVAAVGFIAGPVFFRNFREQAIQYVLLGILITLVGAVLCAASILSFGIPLPLAIGILMGALTSTPGLAAAVESTGSDLALIGYGIAYPFGVIGVVLFVQLAPKFFSVNVRAEAAALEITLKEGNAAFSEQGGVFAVDPLGFFPLVAAIVLGLLCAAIDIPLPGGALFSIGSAGGPMLIGLLFGHFRRVGRLSLSVPLPTLKAMREFGLILFLIGAGTKAGKGFLEILAEHGVALFVHGVAMTLVPMLVGFYVAYRMMRLQMLNALGAICGGMTSTPALGTLIAIAGTEAVAASYAATYPVALICAILSAQFLSMLA